MPRNVAGGRAKKSTSPPSRALEETRDTYSSPAESDTLAIPANQLRTNRDAVRPVDAVVPSKVRPPRRRPARWPRARVGDSENSPERGLRLSREKSTSRYQRPTAETSSMRCCFGRPTRRRRRGRRNDRDTPAVTRFAPVEPYPRRSNPAVETDDCPTNAGETSPHVLPASCPRPALAESLRDGRGRLPTRRPARWPVEIDATTYRVST